MTPAQINGGYMKNILLILVGGTICTALNEKGNLSVSEEAGILLKENYFFLNGYRHLFMMYTLNLQKIYIY